jgi:hypothetical protein
MKPTITAILVAATLSLAAVGAQATDSMTRSAGAPSVAEMLQRKHATELRAQFVREGRSEDIRKLDEATAQRLLLQRNQAYVRVNDQLAHSAGVEGQPIDARAPECDPDTITHGTRSNKPGVNQVR